MSEDSAAMGSATSSTATTIVIGVDDPGTSDPAIALLARLRFPDPRFLLLHFAADRLPFVIGKHDVPFCARRYFELAKVMGHNALQSASAYARALDLDCATHLAQGRPTTRLIEIAEERHADLIAVSDAPTGTSIDPFGGTIVNALVLGSRTSILIARGDPTRSGTVRAVFAMDHSPFADRCLRRFLELAPQGIEEIHVVSAWEIDGREAAMLGQDPAPSPGDVDRWIEAAIEERTGEVCADLQATGYRPRSFVRRGAPKEVIRRAMQETRADLLIVGSQGESAIERALIGSVSLHQAISEPYSLLIVRP